MLTTSSTNPVLTNNEASAASGHQVSPRSGSQPATQRAALAMITAIVTSGNRSDGRLSFSGSRAGQAYSASRLEPMSREFAIAQVNIALPREPLDSPALAEFVANLEPVNALADAAPGFVWRLEDESGDATSIKRLRRRAPDHQHVGLGVDRGTVELRLLRRPPRGDAPPARVDDQARRVSPCPLVAARGRDARRPRRRGSGSNTSAPTARAPTRSPSSSATRLRTPSRPSRASTTASPARRG